MNPRDHLNAVLGFLVAMFFTVSVIAAAMVYKREFQPSPFQRAIHYGVKP